MIEVKIKTVSLDFPDVLDANLPMGTEFEFARDFGNKSAGLFRITGIRRTHYDCLVLRPYDERDNKGTTCIFFHTLQTKVRITVRPCCCQCQCNQKPQGLQLRDIEPGSVVRSTLPDDMYRKHLWLVINDERCGREMGKGLLQIADFKIAYTCHSGTVLDGLFEVIDKLHITQEKV